MEQLYSVQFTKRQLDFLYHYLDQFSEYHYVFIMNQEMEEQTFDIVDTLKDAEEVYTPEELEDKS